MGVVEHSSARVESRISELETAYSSFPVNQTTVSVPSERYEQARAELESLDIFGKVTNDDAEVLHSEEGENPTLPSTTITGTERLESALVDTVEEQTGIVPQVDDVEQATIVGIRDESNPERGTVYRLAVLFSASARSGSLDADAVWKPAVEGAISVRV
jgi:ADP-ribose pyrophosphatase YjhB (NUDIX family)